MSDEKREKAPGTLSSQEVADEFRAFKDKLLGVPATLSGMARKATGSESPQSDAARRDQVEEIFERLSAIESRLSTVESALKQVRDHVMKIKK